MTEPANPEPQEAAELFIDLPSERAADAGERDDARPGSVPAVTRWVTRERIALVVLAALVLLEGVFLLRQRYQSTGSASAAARANSLDATRDPVSGTSATSASEVKPVASSGEAGRLAVRTEPEGAEVTIDGAPRGKAPLTIDELAPGSHEIVVQAGRRTFKQQVRVAAGETTTLLVPLAPTAPPPRPAPAAPTEGTLVVRAPLEIRIFDGDRLVGTSAMDRLRLDRGPHRLTFRNEETGFEQSRTVNIAAGRVTALSLELPQQQVAVNATPWAEVLVDGKPVGETPIGTLRVPLGPHTILFRHPQLGEKSLRVTVKAGEPVRLSVDMRKR